MIRLRQYTGSLTTVLLAGLTHILENINDIVSTISGIVALLVGIATLYHLHLKIRQIKKS